MIDSVSDSVITPCSNYPKRNIRLQKWSWCVKPQILLWIQMLENVCCGVCPGKHLSGWGVWFRNICTRGTRGVWLRTWSFEQRRSDKSSCIFIHAESILRSMFHTIVSICIDKGVMTRDVALHSVLSFSQKIRHKRGYCSRVLEVASYLCLSNTLDYSLFLYFEVPGKVKSFLQKIHPFLNIWVPKRILECWVLENLSSPCWCPGCYVGRDIQATFHSD